MNYVPVNGLRMFAAELGLVGSFWALALIVMRLVGPSTMNTAIC